MRRARVLLEEQCFEDAAGVLDAVVAEHPRDQQAWAMLAYTRVCAGHSQQALAAAETALGLSPGAWFPHAMAGLALLQLGRAEEAVAHVREAAAIEPSDWRILGLLARALQVRGGDLQEAKQVAERMTALAPNEPEAHLAAGRVYAAAGAHERARNAFRRILELNPGSGVAQHELARLRLGKRLNDPAALADAAAGFARAIGVEPDAGRSRQSLDLVLRVFLSKAAYLLFLDAFLVGRLTGHSPSPGGRLIPVALLAVPFGYGWRFASRVTPPVRRHLLGLLTRKGPLRTAAGLESLAAACVIATAVSDASLRAPVAGVGAFAALVGRVIIYTQLEHAARAVRGQPARPAIGPTAMWIIAVALGLTSAFLALAGAQGKANSAAFFVAAAVAAVALYVARTALHRRTHT
ncbi:MAG TPA: tetratricopeptide repeat protein [Solirubrobacteraceae bacterium]